jgi:hypothetical protein
VIGGSMKIQMFMFAVIGLCSLNARADGDGCTPITRCNQNMTTTKDAITGRTIYKTTSSIPATGGCLYGHPPSYSSPDLCISALADVNNQQAANNPTATNDNTTATNETQAYSPTQNSQGSVLGAGSTLANGNLYGANDNLNPNNAKSLVDNSFHQDLADSSGTHAVMPTTNTPTSLNNVSSNPTAPNPTDEYANVKAESIQADMNAQPDPSRVLTVTNPNAVTTNFVSNDPKTIIPAVQIAPTTLTTKQQSQENKLVAQTKDAAADATAIATPNANKTYCGLYGGYSCEVSKSVNAGVAITSQLATQAGTALSQSQGSASTESLQSQGTDVTNKSVYDAQADLLDKSATTNTWIATSQMVMAAGQGFLGYMHMKSQTKVNAAAGDANQTTNDAYTAHKISEDTNKATLATIQTNQTNEIRAQQGAMVVQAAAMASTASQATMGYLNASQAKSAANNLREQGNASAGVNYAFNPTAAVQQNTDPLAMPTPDTGALTATDTPDTSLTGGHADFNPSAGDGGPAGPAPAAFVSSTPAAAAGGAATAPGSASGTSAAKDDAAKEAALAGKPQTGGTYGNDGGSGSKFSKNSGGTAGVGMDAGFADLLKKFLPGGEEDKKSDTAKNLALGDRSPASDQAAVMGRNQNIFDEIHKRYQKKNTEGAVVYGDQT